jgi:hypothetical protein
MEDAARECDLSVLLVKHRQFRQAAQSGAMGDKPVLDFCGVLE